MKIYSTPYCLDAVRRNEVFLYAETKRLASLDGWRAVAIILVLVSHFHWSGGAEDVPSIITSFARYGDFGVRIFFVVSGFLITFLLIREHDDTGKINLRDFYARRSLRIFPVYFSYLFVLFLLQIFSGYSDVASSWLGSLTFTRNILGRGDSATVHLWSLAVEEQFYILWPVAFAAFGLATRTKATVAALMVVVVVSTVARGTVCDGQSFICLKVLGPRSIVNCADQLAIGCMAAFIFRHAADRIPKSSLSFWIGLGLVLAIELQVWPARHYPSLARTLQAFLMAICILCSVSGRPRYAYSALNGTAPAWIGRLSYSLYVWHMLFLPGFMGQAFAHVPFMNWKVWLIPAILTAISSYFLIEKPFLQLRARHRPRPQAFAPHPSS